MEGGGHRRATPPWLTEIAARAITALQTRGNGRDGGWLWVKRWSSGTDLSQSGVTHHIPPHLPKTKDG